MDTEEYLDTLEARNYAVSSKNRILRRTLDRYYSRRSAPQGGEGPPDPSNPRDVRAYDRGSARALQGRVAELRESVERLQSWRQRQTEDAGTLLREVRLLEAFDALIRLNASGVDMDQVRQSPQWARSEEVLGQAESVLRRYRSSPMWQFDEINPSAWEQLTHRFMHGTSALPAATGRAARETARGWTEAGTSGQGQGQGAQGQGQGQGQGGKDQGQGKPSSADRQRQASRGKWTTTLAAAGGIGVVILGGGLVLGILESRGED